MRENVESGFGPDLTEIAVHLGSLGDFAIMIRRETDSNLGPYTERIIADQMQGACFGSLLSASYELDATRRSYHECLVRSTEALRSYLDASRFLINAIEQVAQRYADVDALAAERAERVATELTLAIHFSRIDQTETESATSDSNDYVRLHDIV